MRLGLVIMARLKLQCQLCFYNRFSYVCSCNLKPYHCNPLFYKLNNNASSLLKEAVFRLSYSTKTNDFNSSNREKEGMEKAKPGQPGSSKKKKEIKVYISLLGSDGTFISVTTVEEATKLALRRNLRLVKVMDFDTKAGRSVYKLVTESEYLKGDDWVDSKLRKEKEKSVKGDKVVSLSSTTAEHDVLVKVKQMQKWLEKRFEIRVVITGDSKSGENVFKIIESEIGSYGRIVQKRSKGQDIRFQILPPKKNETPKKTDTPKKVEPLKERGETDAVGKGS